MHFLMKQANIKYFFEERRKRFPKLSVDILNSEAYNSFVYEMIGRGVLIPLKLGNKEKEALKNPEILQKISDLGIPVMKDDLYDEESNNNA